MLEQSVSGVLRLKTETTAGVAGLASVGGFMDTIFIEDNIGKIALICASVVFLIGFFLGWLVGHLRNNNYMQALMNKIEAGKAEIEKLKAGLKDSGEFFNHEIAVLTKEIDRRQCIINAYRIGQDCAPHL